MNNKVFIIAEAGVNHNGSIVTAEQLIDAAANSGADAIKFQSFKADKLVSYKAPKAEYQKKNTPHSESQFEMIRKLELTPENHFDLLLHCKKRNITFLSSAFDLESIELLKRLKLSLFKIPSGEITNYPYLKNIGSLKKSIILSTGMSTLNEIKNALTVLICSGTKRNKITVLHCNTEYPTPFEDVNLQAMLTIKNTFNISVGYSDHTEGIAIPIAATALGATVIEKHLTLDKKMNGPDHKASLEPHEFSKMVKSIRDITSAIGNGIKKPSKSEINNIIIARKSIVAKTFILKNDVFSENNITIKRPGNGINPMKWESVLGRKSKYYFKKDDLIKL